MQLTEAKAGCAPRIYSIAKQVCELLQLSSFEMWCLKLAQVSDTALKSKPRPALRFMVLPGEVSPLYSHPVPLYSQLHPLQVWVYTTACLLDQRT